MIELRPETAPASAGNKPPSNHNIVALGVPDDNESPDYEALAEAEGLPPWLTPEVFVKMARTMPGGRRLNVRMVRRWIAEKRISAKPDLSAAADDDSAETVTLVRWLIPGAQLYVLRARGFLTPPKGRGKLLGDYRRLGERGFVSQKPRRKADE